MTTVQYSYLNGVEGKPKCTANASSRVSKSDGVCENHHLIHRVVLHSRSKHTQRNTDTKLLPRKTRTLYYGFAMWANRPSGLNLKCVNRGKGGKCEGECANPTPSASATPGLCRTKFAPCTTDSQCCQCGGIDTPGGPPYQLALKCFKKGKDDGRCEFSSRVFHSQHYHNVHTIINTIAHTRCG